MDITEIRIKLMEDAGERLQAFCSITFDDCFVIRDLKIIEGTNGPFVAMPSRKLTGHCPQCSCKNHLRAPYCNQCGGRLNQDRAPKDEDGRAKLYADIAHPINSACREMIQERVTKEFYQELERAKLPGYISRYDDFDLDEHSPRPIAARTSSSRPQPAKPASLRTTSHVQTAQPAARGPHRMAVPVSALISAPQPFVPMPYSSAAPGQQLATTYQQSNEKPPSSSQRETVQAKTPQSATVIHAAHDQAAGDIHAPKSISPAHANGQSPGDFGAGIF